MQATLNYNVARQIIQNNLWPDMTAQECRQPDIRPAGNICFFQAKTGLRVGKLKPDGLYRGPRRNITTLEQLAADNGLNLNCLVIVPIPQVPKPKQQVVHHTKTKKHQKATPQPRDTLSIRDILNAKKKPQNA